MRRHYHGGNVVISGDQLIDLLEKVAWMTDRDYKLEWDKKKKLLPKVRNRDDPSLSSSYKPQQKVLAYACYRHIETFIKGQ